MNVHGPWTRTPVHTTRWSKKTSTARVDSDGHLLSKRSGCSATSVECQMIDCWRHRCWKRTRTTCTKVDWQHPDAVWQRHRCSDDDREQRQLEKILGWPLQSLLITGFKAGTHPCSRAVLTVDVYHYWVSICNWEYMPTHGHKRA